MKRLITLLTLGLICSCNSQNEGSAEEKIQVFRDTVILKERVVDTIHVHHHEEDSYRQSNYFITERLPDWFRHSDLVHDLKLLNEYKIENRLNPLYLEADFNGDGHLDIALAIRHLSTEKVGFAIIHGETNVIHIIAAGRPVKNGLSDNMDYMDIWKVNRARLNEAGLEETTGTGPKGELILNNPSLQLEKSEIGGGQIYWNGNEYAYFHQTC